MVPEAFSQHPPALVLFRFRSSDRPAAFPPIETDFTQEVRRDSSLPLPILLLRIGPPLPLLQPFWGLVSDLLSTRAVIHTVLLCAFFLASASTLRFVRPTISHNLLCTNPSSTTSFLVTIRCLSVHASSVFLRSIAWMGSSHSPSFNTSRSCLAAHSSFQQTILACFKKHFSHSAGKKHLYPPPTVLKKRKVCHCDHLMPRSRVSHITAPAGPLTCRQVQN